MKRQIKMFLGSLIVVGTGALTAGCSKAAGGLENLDGNAVIVITLALIAGLGFLLTSVVSVIEDTRL